MSKYDRLKKQNDAAFAAVRAETAKFQIIADESRRVANVARHAGEILSELDRDFESATKLDSQDIAFLFFAAALQCARWILLPELDFDFSKTPQSERLTSQQGGQIEQREIRKYLDEHAEDSIIGSKRRFYTWQQIITSPVPYDAMRGSARIHIDGFESKEDGKSLYGKNHHAATWGHDPVMGWIFGPLNITSRMITFRDFQTYHVAAIGNGNEQLITRKSSLGAMVSKSIDSWQEDNKRLFAAVAKQGMHQASDKYTKYGLQIPFISGDRAQKLLEQGWNSNEAERMLSKISSNLAVIGAQAGLSILINQLIKALHLLCYDETRHGRISLYEVKTRKILSYSNAIASGSNILYSAITQDYKKLDIGGIIVTIYRLITDAKFIKSIKQEFLANEWYNIVMGEDLGF